MSATIRASSESQGSAASATPAQLLMRRETRVAYGRAPHSLLDNPLPEASWQLVGDEFLLRAAGLHYFHYRKGEGVVIERGEGAELSEEALWLDGSVYSAVAALNGLLPIHASAVAVHDSVVAFTGPAGAGKSTLVAALGRRGFPMFCDDTLVLDLSDPDRIVCLPGHKRLKLTAEALGLTGAGRQEKVSPTVDKFYAEPVGGHFQAVLPLGELIFMEEDYEIALTRLSYAERFLRLQDDHQTARLFAAARRLDRAAQFAHLSRLSSQIPMARFARPADSSRFDESLACVVAHIGEQSASARGRP